MSLDHLSDHELVGRLRQIRDLEGYSAELRDSLTLLVDLGRTLTADQRERATAIVLGAARVLAVATLTPLQRAVLDAVGVKVTDLRKLARKVGADVEDVEAALEVLRGRDWLAREGEPAQWKVTPWAWRQLEREQEARAGGAA